VINEPNASTDSGPEKDEAKAANRPMSFLRRLIRALPSILFLMLLVWIFGQVGILHKLETIASDTEMLLNRGPNESRVAFVTITDEDYKSVFGGISPLQPEKLEALITAVAKGDPAVICVDVDTSSKIFRERFKVHSRGPRIVWEREVRNIPEDADLSNYDKIEPEDVLGGRVDLDPSRNSTGLPLLIEDAEDKVTRRYRRVIKTSIGELPSLPWAVVKLYFENRPDELAKLPETSEELLIHFAPDRQQSRRINLSSSKVQQLASQWPEASPIRNKIVVLGGSYLDQDRHDTPIGRLTGAEVLANVIETELNGGGYRPPGEVILFALELFEALVLILLFHIRPFLKALLTSLLLSPVLAFVCSQIAFRDWIHVLHFLPIILGLILFETYEHYRRSAVPRLYHDIVGTPRV
jgi:CHASE2 domain-containing sensor protein